MLIMVISMYYYFNSFFIYSILGHLLETVVGMIQGWSFKSGILYGFWTPVYGIGAVLITYFYHLLIKGKKEHLVWRFLSFLVLVMVSLSFFEWLGGVLIERFFHTIFWDYRSHRFAIGKYISLEMALVWGGLAILFVSFIKPWMDYIIQKIPYVVTCLFTFLFAVDVILTLVFKVK